MEIFCRQRDVASASAGEASIWPNPMRVLVQGPAGHSSSEVAQPLNYLWPCWPPTAREGRARARFLLAPLLPAPRGRTWHVHKPPRSGGGGRCGWRGRRVIMKECPLLPWWKRTESILSFLRSRPRTAFWTLLLTLRATLFLLKDSCSWQNIKWPSELNSPIPIHFSSLSLKMSMVTLAISCYVQPWFMGRTTRVPVQCCSLQHQTFTTRHIVLSGTISPLFPSSISDIYVGHYMVAPGDGEMTQ